MVIDKQNTSWVLKFFNITFAEPAIFSFLYTIRAAFGWENQGDNATFLFLFHPWWVDLWVVLRGDPCTQSQQPATLKEKKGKGYRSLCNLTNQLLFGRKTKVHCKLRVKKVVDTNHCSQNLLRKLSCSLAILVLRNRSHWHFVGGLF